MATGSLDANGIWIYGEDDSEATFSALLNKLGESTSDALTPLVASGRVVNTVSVTKLSPYSSTSTSFVDVTGLSASITPKSAANKVLVRITFFTGNNNSGQPNNFNIVRNSTNLAQSTGGSSSQTLATYTANASSGDVSVVEFLDSPATTSSTTYKLQARTGGGTLYVGAYGVGLFATSVSTITLMEITG
jgi:hypothetical protein